MHDDLARQLSPCASPSETATLFADGAVTPGAEQRAQPAARGVRVEARPVAALPGDGAELSGVRLEDGEVIEIGALFAQPRARMASPLAQQLGCAFDHAPAGPIIRTDALKATSVPGVFAAGDAARAFTNATLAAADGVLAGVSAHRSMIFAGH